MTGRCGNRHDVSCICKHCIERPRSLTQAKAERLEAFAEALESQSKSLTEFDEGLWGTMVDFMTVYSKEDISVTFKDGTEIQIG